MRPPRTGRGGFFRPAGAAPAGHFRTSVHASPLFAEAVRRCCAGWTRRSAGPTARPGRRRRRPGRAAGRRGGRRPATRRRLRPLAVEVAAARRRADDRRVDVAELPPVSGLLVANEWLDDVPLDVSS